jgi:hypothetical protein
MTSPESPDLVPRSRTGVPGFDAILGGGGPPLDQFQGILSGPRTSQELRSPLPEERP